MEIHDMALQLAKLHERVNGVVRDVGEHKEDARDIHKRIDAQGERMTALEKKLFFIAGAASTGGGAIGAIIGKLLTGFGG